MIDKLNALIAGHGFSSVAVSAVVGFAIKHWLPQFSSWITTEATDRVVTKALALFKMSLRKVGASEDEIKSVKTVVAQITARVLADEQKDIQAS